MMQRIYKIAFLLPNLESQGGVTVSVQTISSYLCSLGHNVHLFPVGKTDIKASSTTHIVNTNRKSEQIKTIKHLFEHEREKGEFDLVVSNNLITNYLSHYLGLKDNHLIILRQPSLLKRKNIFSQIKQRLYYPIIYNDKNIVTISQCLLDDFLRRFSYIKPNSTRVIYNAFNRDTTLQKAEQTISLPTDNYIINVGRFTKTKNQFMLIEAFKNIENIDIDLILLGDGKERSNLKKLIKKHKLEDRIYFVDWQENPYPWIKNAKLLVHTSKSETFGRVILEGLALDTPVVCTDIKCGPNEILTKDLKNFLVSIDSVEELTDAINRALIDYPKITSKHLEKFYIENITQKYIDFIESL